jgi:archaellum component FlaC
LKGEFVMFPKNLWPKRNTEHKRADTVVELLVDSKLADRMAALEKRLAHIESEITEIDYDAEQQKAQANSDNRVMSEEINKLKSSIKDLSHSYARLTTLSTHTAAMAASKKELMELVESLADCLNQIKDKENLPF